MNYSQETSFPMHSFENEMDCYETDKQMPGSNPVFERKGKQSVAYDLNFWNDGLAKQAIVDYVNQVTHPASPDFVPVADRIAVFDNDGTLWCEKPAYIQLYFAIQRLKYLAGIDPTLLEQPGYKAAAAGDLAYFDSLYPGNIPELMKLVFDSHTGMSQAEFEEQVTSFFSQSVHPRYGVPFQLLTYQPMTELIRYLEAHEFRVFIVSAGGMSFMRNVAEEIYGIGRERVIGSNIIFETHMTENGPVLYRKSGLIDPVSDGPAKPVYIELHIGRKPILAVGNSDGDLDMLWYSETHSYKSLQLLVHHDDSEREYAYDHGAENVLRLASARNWQLISMKRDFLHVFPF
jgi:phosphoserine phosphatase